MQYFHNSPQYHQVLTKQGGILFNKRSIGLSEVDIKANRLKWTGVLELISVNNNANNNLNWPVICRLALRVGWDRWISRMDRISYQFSIQSHQKILTYLLYEVIKLIVSCHACNTLQFKTVSELLYFWKKDRMHI